MAGGAPEIVSISHLLSGQRRLDEFKMFVLPGGFSYGDDLGAGRVWSLALSHSLRHQVEAFVASGRPVLGICNGFQALIKAGLLPAGPAERVWAEERPATLTHNASGKFECRWVELEVNQASQCVFTAGLNEAIYCPVAHGEGRVVTRDTASLARLEENGQVALRYASSSSTSLGYPENPNGSINHIAALCNPAGNVMGMMPHPEDHIWPTQHPAYHRGESGRLGLVLFENGVRFAAQV
jgi:phosphoribosylformylglycinamidine synthase I